MGIGLIFRSILKPELQKVFFFVVLYFISNGFVDFEIIFKLFPVNYLEPTLFKNILITGYKKDANFSKIAIIIVLNEYIK